MTAPDMQVFRPGLLAGQVALITGGGTGIGFGVAELLGESGISLVHSSRSNIIGSIDSARCAGIHVASTPSNDMARTTPANTSGSRGVA